MNSKKAIRFRQWATSVFKEYISNGYAINSEKITHQRFQELENDVDTLKTKVFAFSKLNIDISSFELFNKRKNI